MYRVRDRDDSFDPTAHQHLQTSMHALGSVLQVRQDRHVSRCFQGILDPPNDETAIWVGDVKHKDADTVGPLASQRARLEIRKIAKLERRLLYQSLCHGGDPAPR